MIRRTADGAVGSDGTGVAVAIEDVAHELYGALPADFVSTRTAAAKEARASGDAPLARRIAALRKPTKAAWATNLLVREERSRVEALLELGTELRDAQERLDAAVLRGRLLGGVSSSPSWSALPAGSRSRRVSPSETPARTRSRPR